ncbi:MAG: acetolactate synthase small subunit [Planctomycetes bacterium RIFCSPHIGHO2_12_FULL_52_36]|nr:MAG: acetolactate synthase small subunit [Planctomycetes bacterium RIFCSPHIGHO2_02_FULL_52_58]OHB94072.1 MAG: acetolactate synthase small subunit [Planctomycetes bacterium RIFCSPHIGHO2_12_FULL_52_36]
MRHVITALVENKVGVLARIVGLFTSRGFNIDSLTVGETENPELSRLTVVVKGDDATIEQVRKQLGKVIDVIKVIDLTETPYVERDLLLVKVNVPPGKRGEILEIVDVFRGKIIDVGQKDLIIELSGTEDKLEAMIKLLHTYGIKEMARTGQIAMARGTKQ